MEQRPAAEAGVDVSADRSKLGLARSSSGARLRFAVGALALALAAGFGTPTIARAIAQAWRLPIETPLVAVGLIVALASLVLGWSLGNRVDTLTDEARRDPVTRVGNRRLWEECLAHEVNRAASAKMPLSLLVLDVDNLKKLNDLAGHGTGDLALSIVGDVLNGTCRSRDVAARFGGDEFAILLPRTRACEALVVADRIRAELARHRAAYPAPLNELLTVSMGIADLSVVDDPRPNALFDAADRALYVAKQAGRNRIEVAERHDHHQQRTSTVIVLDERRRTKRPRPRHHAGKR